MKKNRFLVFARDTLKLIKKNGEIVEGIKAHVEKNIFTIYDTTISIEEEDIFEREVPNDIERYKVIDRGYTKAFRAIPERYRVAVEKITNIKKNTEGNTVMFKKLAPLLKRALNEAKRNADKNDYFDANNCLAENGSPIKNQMFTELENQGYIRNVADGGIYQLEAKSFTYDDDEAEHERKNAPSISMGDVHIDGGSRFNLNSVDNSINITLSKNDEVLFDNVLKTLEESSIENKEDIKLSINEMKQTVGKPSFIQKYNSFIQSVAHHMIIFAPFIPQLSALMERLN